MTDELTCQCCNNEPAVGVARALGIGMPVSLAYGRKCLEAGVEAYGLLVANTATFTDVEHYETDTAPWWKDLVDISLEYHGITKEKFFEDVQRKKAIQRANLEAYNKTQAKVLEELNAQYCDVEWCRAPKTTGCEHNRVN